MRLRVDFNLIATVLAIVALLEGLAIFVNAHQVTLHGSSYFDGFARGTISIAGVQLAILGGIALLALWLPREKIPNDHLRA
ncbi:hypothetical protein AOA80_04495 [Methanomassiliicoccales archaeon RumEn M1]|nr:hypothetical protein AOA80_04495 [Methanomassiliicoccales archaeon RumEn M1]